MSGVRVAVLDYGMGNLRSVEKAFEHVGAQATVTNDHEEIRGAAGIVLPGVGAFPKAMESIRRLGLDELIGERLTLGVPMLGICLGMQLLFERSTELGGATGLGLLAGEVRPLDAPGLKVPQIGWNAISWKRASRLCQGLPDPCGFYHVHSFAPHPADPGDIARHRPVRHRVRHRRGARARLRRAVPPREVGARRPAAARQLHRDLRAWRPQPRRMILLPAIDIRGGKAVRLQRGDFSKETVYQDDPLDAAASFVEAGANFLHVVDLDGAREGHPVNLEHLRRITRELGVAVQYGGGLRSLPAVREALAAGAERVVVGTAAYSDTDFVDTLLETWEHRLVIAVDVRDGHVSVAGWTKATQMLPEDVIARLQRRGVKQFMYTNVDRDGTLEGPDLDEVRRISAVVRGRFLYSGGISTAEDLSALKELRLVNLAGVVSGKALYERRFTVAEGQAALAD